MNVERFALVTHPLPLSRGDFFQKGTSDGKFILIVSFSRSLKFMKI
jgi:hypothetical protein